MTPMDHADMMNSSNDDQLGEPAHLVPHGAGSKPTAAAFLKKHECPNLQL